MNIGNKITWDEARQVMLDRAYKEWKSARSKLTPQIIRSLPTNVYGVTCPYWSAITRYNEATEALVVLLVERYEKESQAKETP